MPATQIQPAEIAASLAPFDELWGASVNLELHERSTRSIRFPLPDPIMLPDGYMFDVRAGTQRGAVMAEKRRNPLPFGIKSYWGLTLDFRHPFHQVDSFQGPVLGFGRRNNNSHSINMYVFNPEMTQRAEVWSHMVLTMLGPEGEPEFVRTNS